MGVDSKCYGHLETERTNAIRDSSSAEDREQSEGL